MERDQALGEWLVTYDGAQYPLDMRKWYFKENRRCEQWLGITQDQLKANLDGGIAHPGFGDALAFVVWMALSRAGAAPDSLDDLDFDMAGNVLTPAHPDEFEAALAELQTEAEAGPLDDGASPTG